MLKGNLVVGDNLSVVLHAESLEDMLILAGTKHPGERSGEIRLRIDLEQSGAPLEVLLDSIPTDVDSNAVLPAAKGS